MKQREPPTIPQHFIAGTSAGVLSSAILHPIDVVKVRYQVREFKLNYLMISYDARFLTKLEKLTSPCLALSRQSCQRKVTAVF
jgi:hypothetical protein